MENPKNQLATKLKEANNILVTVSTNPSVDQLAAAIGLTLFLTKLKKHATTVFSGEVPSTLDFLKPEETIEENTDSLRDFIISLDKAKADKIRYKVEDTMVKIFITPYRTSISEQDLVYSQGDFNVDVVVALGVLNRDDIDQAITTHGRILHDATVATVNLKENSDVGALDWTDPQASSLCEMIVALTDLLKTNSLDSQMSTALLTGIVAETERFSNEKTTSTTMAASSKLMAAGANQQLVATQLEAPISSGSSDEPKQSGGGQGGSDQQPQDADIDAAGALHIDHTASNDQKHMPSGQPDPRAESFEPRELPNPLDSTELDVRDNSSTEQSEGGQDPRRFLDDQPAIRDQKDEELFGLSPSEGKPAEVEKSSDNKRITEPPKFGGQLSAAADDSSNSASPLNLPPIDTPLLSRDSDNDASNLDRQPPPPMPPNLMQAAGPNETGTSTPPPAASITPPPKPSFVELRDKTLDAIEKKVDSSHVREAEMSRLPESFTKTLDGATLAGIEERVGASRKGVDSQDQKASDVDYKKRATDQAARAMSDKTLDAIEKKVDSSHVDEQLKPEVPKIIPSASRDKHKEDIVRLEYESHESEPPEATDESKDSKAPSTDDLSAIEAAIREDMASTKAKPDSPEKTDKDSTDKTHGGVLTGDKAKQQDDARGAVEHAIVTGGDGRTSLPALDGIGATGAVDVNHSEEKTDKAPPTTPPPIPVQPPSTDISIDDKGNLSYPRNLVPVNDKLPRDKTAAPEVDASAPPPVPPPMLPPTPVGSASSNK